MTPGGHWRLRWLEGGRRRETTAPTRRDAMSKAADVVARLAQGRPTDLAQAPAELLVTHYLDPARRPVRGRAWSARHREEQEAYCRRFVSPVIAGVELGQLSRLHFNGVLAQASTTSVAAHLRAAGRPWSAPAWRRACCWPARTCCGGCAGRRRRGEMAALTGDRVDPTRRRITVDRQVVETRHDLALSLPKNRRRRTTMYPAAIPGGLDLAALVARRVAEVGPTGLLFPRPKATGPGAPTTGATPSSPPPPPRAGPAITTAGGCGPSTPCATSSPPGPWPSPAPASRTSPSSWAIPPCG